MSMCARVPYDYNLEHQARRLMTAANNHEAQHFIALYKNQYWLYHYWTVESDERVEEMIKKHTEDLKKHEAGLVRFVFKEQKKRYGRNQKRFTDIYLFKD